MRQTLALVVLLATMWPHLGAMQCSTMEPHGNHHEQVTAGHHHGDTTECPAVLACASVMREGSVQTRLVAAESPPPPRGQSHGAAPHPSFLGTDTPPPRLVI